MFCCFVVSNFLVFVFVIVFSSCGVCFENGLCVMCESERGCWMFFVFVFLFWKTMEVPVAKSYMERYCRTS